MPNQRLLAVLTAFILVSGAPSVNAAYTMSDLMEIERLLVARDWNGLRAHLRQAPGLLDGADPLAYELRSFIASVDSGLLDSFSAPDAAFLDVVQSLQDSY